MQDNGLLKYYRTEYANKKGELKVNLTPPYVMPLREYMFVPYPTRIEAVKVSEDWGNGQVLINNEDYFIKNNSKLKNDNEILLSQVYSKFGLKSAIYTPIEFVEFLSEEKINGVISKSICGPRVVTAHGLIERLIKTDNKFAFEEYYANIFNFEKYLSSKAMTNYLKMRILDVATHNTDRHAGNFYYNLDNNGIAQDLTLIDYGASYVPHKNRNLEYYSCLVGEQEEERYDILNHFRHDELIHKYIKPYELANELGNLSVKEVAEDIENTTGYELEKELIEAYDQNFYSMAEDLTKYN